MADYSKTKASTSAEGGGGADAAHGLTYHRILAMIFILRLKLCRDNDPTFEYFIHLEKRDYGKFDDIVITYRIKGIWKELCIQCKHSSNKNTISASDFLIGNKSNKFALKSYISSYKNIVEKSDSQISERHFLLMNNRTIDIKHNSFTINENTFEEIAICENVLSESVFRFTEDTIENTSLCTEINGKLNEIDTVKKFLKDFAFVPTKNTKEFECDIKNILKKLCKNDSIEAKNLENELYIFTDEKISQSERISYKDVSKLFVPSNYKVPSLHFKVRDPNYLFTGRKDQLEILHSAIQEKKTGFIIDVAITGTSGIGKSQLTLQFIRKYKDEFKNIIWIDAESHTSIENSFKDLAYECKLLDMGDKNINMKLLIKNIYSYLSKRGQSLIVFDDATQFNSDNNAKGICDYLPENTINENLFVIVTSQNRKWHNKTNIDLEIFSDIESKEFLSQTDINKLGTQKELKQFCKKIGNLPIALQTGAAYIMRQNEMCLMFGQSGYFVSNFLKEFKFNFREVIRFDNDSSKKVLKEIWNKTFLLIKSSKNVGSLALFMLCLLSYFDCDGMPIKLLQSIPKSEKDIYLSIKLLSDFSLLDIQKDKIFMHKLLQIVVREELVEFNSYVCFEVIDSGYNILLTANIPVNKFNENKSFINIATNFFRNTNSKYYSDNLDILVNKIHDLCFLNFEFEKALAICDELLDIQMKKFGDKSEKVVQSRILKLKTQVLLYNCDVNYILEIEDIKAVMKSINYDIPPHFYLIFQEIKAYHYVIIGKYFESKNIILKCLKRENLSEIDTKYTVLLQCMVNIIECGSINLQIDEIKYVKKCWKQIAKKSNPYSFQIKDTFATFYKNLKKYEKALEILDNLLEMTIELYGLRHNKTVSVLIEKASIYIEMGNKNIAHNILNQASKILKNNKLNMCSLESLSLLCTNYCRLNDFDNNESCAKLVVDFIHKNRDLEMHSTHLTLLMNMSLAYKKQGLYPKAYESANQVFKLTMKSPSGLKNIKTLETFLNLLEIMYIMEKYEAIVNKVMNKYNFFNTDI